jgi:hypothetical protein
MKLSPSRKCSTFLQVAVLLLTIILAASCQKEPAVSAGQEPDFGIYLLDNDSQLLSGNDIDSFNTGNGVFALNAKGTEKWQSHFAEIEPKLKDSLFGRSFVIKIDGEGVCSGVIWSMLSSSSRQDIVLLDALSTIGFQHNAIRLQTVYSGYESATAPAISAAIANYFNSR